MPYPRPPPCYGQAAKNNPACNRALADEAISDLSPLPPHQVADMYNIASSGRKVKEKTLKKTLDK